MLLVVEIGRVVGFSTLYLQELLIYKHEQKQSESNRSSLSAQSSSESLLSPITDKVTSSKIENTVDGEYRYVSSDFSERCAHNYLKRYKAQFDYSEVH